MGEVQYTRSGRIDTHKDCLKQSSGYHESWLLVLSLVDQLNANKVVKIYKTRMTIEENIRDVKSAENGLRMNRNTTIESERFIVWFMLSALESFIAWIVGYTSEQMQLHYDFQANTCRTKRILSFFYLSCQIIRKKIQIIIDFKMIHAEAWELKTS